MVNNFSVRVVPVVSTSACQRTPARVYQPMVVAEANTSQNLSCQSPGQAVQTCLWGHSVNRTSEAILIDQQVVENGGRTTLDGISYAGGNDELEAGRCTLNIANVTEDHVGLWSCILISRQNATVSSGAVHLGKRRFLHFSMTLKVFINFTLTLWQP